MACDPRLSVRSAGEGVISEVELSMGHQVMRSGAAVSPETDRIAVILPCLNEAGAIADVVRRFHAAVPQAVVYVVDNGSTDGTADDARAAGAEVLIEPARGKGNAVRRGFTAIDADIYVIADGDGTYDETAASRLIDLLVDQRLDMVVAARRKTSDEAFRSGHQWGNRLFNRVLAVSFGSSFKDCFSGYRVFSNRYVKSFPALTDGFEIETEMTIHAILLRMAVAEVECDYGARPPGQASKLKTYRDGFRILLSIIDFMRQHRPLAFFGVIAGALFGAGLALFVPILAEFGRTGLVPRLPTLMVSVGLGVVSVLLMACGLILDTTTRTQLEIRRLIYLNTLRGPRGRSDG